MTTLKRQTSPLPEKAVVAVLRAPTAEHFLSASTVLWENGVRCFEFTMTSCGALEAVTAFRRRFPEAVVGVGTVRTVEHLITAKEAGATFAVSQVYLPTLLEEAQRIGLPFVPGALTPTEIITAWETGVVPMVKVSPIGTAGGVAYLNELRGPMPDVALMPTGGVTLEAAPRYLSAGAAAVGVSGALFETSLISGNLTRLADRAAALSPALITSLNGIRP